MPGARARPFPRGRAIGQNVRPVAALTVVDLFDGSALVVDGDAPSPRALQELEVWGLVPDSSDGDEPHRADASQWQQALEAGPLAIAVIHGVLGNAVFAAFPAAARYLKDLRASRRGVDDAASASATTRRALTAMGAGDGTVEQATRDGEGVWHVGFRLEDGRTGSARIAADGAVTHVTLGAE